MNGTVGTKSGFQLTWPSGSAIFALCTLRPTHTFRYSKREHSPYNYQCQISHENRLFHPFFVFRNCESTFCWCPIFPKKWLMQNWPRKFFELSLMGFFGLILNVFLQLQMRYLIMVQNVVDFPESNVIFIFTPFDQRSGKISALKNTIAAIITFSHYSFTIDVHTIFTRWIDETRTYQFDLSLDLMSKKLLQQSMKLKMTNIPISDSIEGADKVKIGVGVIY